MCEQRKITVEIPNKSYLMIRRRMDNVDSKTSRVLSKYLFRYMSIIEEGERTLFRKFTQNQAVALADIILKIHNDDEMTWPEMMMYSGPNLAAAVKLFDQSNDYW